MALAEKLAGLPDSPGVYLMKDAGGAIIYVGKASSLRNRVRSYFHNGTGREAKVRALLGHLADLDFIVTDSPVEALILENNLIKEHRPRYNINLRDDKNYPYIKVTVQEEFPRVLVTRRVARDGSRYFGPYTRAGAMRETLRLVRRIFPLRTCSNHNFGNRSRPCLDADIGRCIAPCSGKVAPETYCGLVNDLLQFLEGRQGELVKDLRARMAAAAEDLRFEDAARLRDQVQGIEEVLTRQKMVSEGREERDVIGLAREGAQAWAVVFVVRGGKVLGRREFRLTNAAEAPEGEVLAAFLKQYYSRAEDIPPQVLLGAELEEEEALVIASWLGGRRGRRVELVTPRRGLKRDLVGMAQKNARLVLEIHTRVEESGDGIGLSDRASDGAVSGQDRERKLPLNTEVAQAELGRSLELQYPPRRIECYDISNIQGADSVGSMVVCQDGDLAPSEYRRFRINTVQGPDDFASLEEVLGRRFARTRGQDTGAGPAGKFSRLPDLVVVDGGRGQISAVRRALAACGLGHLPVCGLAKAEELIYRGDGGEPLRLPRDSMALKLLMALRDEAHRFALTYHRRLRRRHLRESFLDGVPGIGSRRKQILLRHFGSLAMLRQAGLEELAAVKGMNRSAAEALYRAVQTSGQANGH